MGCVSLDEDTRREKYMLLGFDEDVARSAAADGDSYLAGTTLLHVCWGIINSWAKPGALRQIPAAVHLANEGAELVELTQFARAVAYATIYDVLYLLDEGPEQRLRQSLGEWEPGFPTWRLVLADAEEAPTEDVLEGLHEGLLSADPSGQEGSDFLPD
jgi:hypothetical protein